MPIPDTAPNLRRQTMRDEIFPTLREWIITGALEPGEVLKDRELAERLGVSRTPVREALQRLRDEGLVEAESNRWTRVTYLDEGTSELVTPIVMVLEALAIEQAGPRLTEADLEAMEDDNERLEKALRRRRLAEASAADEAFHSRFVQRCGNPDLIAVIEAMRVKLKRIEYARLPRPVVEAASVEDHRRVIEAVRRKAYAKAAAAVRANWTDSLARFRTTLDDAGEPRA